MTFIDLVLKCSAQGVGTPKYLSQLVRFIRQANVSKHFYFCFLFLSINYNDLLVAIYPDRALTLRM